MNKGCRRTAFPDFRAVLFPSRGTKYTGLNGWKQDEDDLSVSCMLLATVTGPGHSGPRRLWEEEKISPRLVDSLQRCVWGHQVILLCHRESLHEN